MLRNIITHPGTGTEIVAEICAGLGANLEIVTSLAQAKKARFDGLILLGGSDIDTRFYGEQRRHAYSPDRSRDAIEWYLTRRAFNQNIPTFGICRGHQMLAVAAGGSLYQDIRQQGATRWHSPEHPLTELLNPLEDILDGIFYGTDRVVNSYHHQAVKRPPTDSPDYKQYPPFGFSVQARAHDGLVEAIWRSGYLGVQFHPELMYNSNKKWGELFRWFVEDELCGY